ncbi:hypothetical protein CEE45_16225 [Candidatus Heimdallarchaeota archaeon B3_Heim]|nr:MAG: hypothetical protein CEE45_16225 [Candidatus Heimdallarchaeota archaeon B3_Heim]
MTYQTYQPNDTKGWTTWLARAVGLVEILIGVGIILLGLATIIAGIIDLGDASDTIIGEDLTALFGGLFLLFMGGLIIIGAIVLFIGLGLWNLSSFSLWLNVLGVFLYIGSGLLSLPDTIDPLNPEILSLVIPAIFGLYLLLIKSKFH